MFFDRNDVRILAGLQREGRLSVVELAESIGLSPTPCARRIRALEANGAIEGYAAVLNPARVGLGAVADRPLLVAEAAQALIGTSFDEAAQKKLETAIRAACRPIDDKRGTKEFRIEVAGVLARRAAGIALDRARKG